MNQEFLNILERTGAIMKNGHFVGASELHFDTYVNKNLLYVHTADTGRACELLAEKCKDLDIEVVASPALGGIVLSQWLAFYLSKLKGVEILSVFTEKDKEEKQVLKRGYDKFIKNKKVLVVEDVITTGGSVNSAIEVIRDAGGIVEFTAVLVNKNPEIKDEINRTKLISLSEVFVDTFNAKDCPLCKDGVPVNQEVGHGKKFIENESNR